MTRKLKLSFASVIIIGTMLTAVGFALFRGYLDRGDFEIKETKWSPTKQVAMTVRRSDHEALNGDQYFVLIGDHVFSHTETRHALHSNKVIFSTDRDCLTLSWQASNNLVVTCGGSPITKSEINTQQYKSGTTAISYVNVGVADSGN